MHLNFVFYNSVFTEGVHLLQRDKHSLLLSWLSNVLAVSCFPVYPTERLWLSPGLADSRNYARCVLHYGPAVVRGCNSPLHLPR